MEIKYITERIDKNKMTEQERQLIIKMAKCVLEKSTHRNNGIVDYKEVEQETQIPINIIQSVARQICKCVMLSNIVEDVDICDNNSFDVMLRKRTLVSGR